MSLFAERRPASDAYSRGFVRGEDSYVPGEELIVCAGEVTKMLACCRLCRCTWGCPPGGLVHPEFNRMGERCPASGSWLGPTSAEIRAR